VYAVFVADSSGILEVIDVVENYGDAQDLKDLYSSGDYIPGLRTSPRSVSESVVIQEIDVSEFL